MGYQQLWLSYNQLFNLFFFLILCQVTCLHTQLCSQEQNSALLQLKGTFSLDKLASWDCDFFENTSFPKTESWKRGSDCCSWDGVDCDGETGQVIGLDLSCSWLKGTIHPNSSLFLSFPHLQKLNLAHNDFSISHISPEFTRFTELTHLNLSDCGFSGKVPLGISFLNKLLSLDLSRNDDLRLEKGGFELLIQNLSKIRDLDLFGVNISSSVVPNSMLNLTSLRTLSLGGSGLRGEFPSGIFHLPHLQEFNLQDEEALTGYLPDFMNLSYPLQQLWLFHTGFSGVLPDSVANLKSLEVLVLEYCKFHGSIPTSLWNLSQITGLEFLGNNFSGTLPSSISNLRNVNVMVLSENNFRGFLPSSLSNLSNLEILYLSGNNFTGPFLWDAKLTKLQLLSLSYNRLTGPLPPHVILPPSLKWLSIAGNLINGAIPSWIFELPALKDLCLSNNSLTGPLPLQVIVNPSLLILDISQNLINGTIPSWVFELPALEYLDVSNNSLTGPLPLQVIAPPNLTSLRISQNLINGTMPSWVFEFPALEYLDVSSNSLTGPLPLQVIAAPNLTSLRISQNFINGTIPSWVFELPALEYLSLSYNKLVGLTLEFQSVFLQIIDLSNNNLQGTVPNSTFELPNLSHLILSFNSFSGTIPESNRFSENLVVLELRMNNFSGTIHDSFTMRNRLKTINLDDNEFEGPIPKSLVNCTNLEVLDLRRNKFFDKFPHWLGNLPNLQVLVLQSNKFHGSILSSKTKFPFPKLRVLDMSNNHFTGPLPMKYFKSFKAMMNVDEVHFELEYMGTEMDIPEGKGSFRIRQHYYSSTFVIKGSTTEMEKILTIFTAIDLSRNNFQGDIPQNIGGLNSIRGLNLSHNSLKGHMPKSLGNLTKLEWLDLSSNKLSGEIPQQLTNLISLGTLNLSQNRLTGPIPKGKQFDTFSNDSYINNLALCGPPLSNACGDPKATQPPPSTFEKEEDSEDGSGFCWEVILPGYGFGLVIGLVMGYLMFSFRKPEWLVKMVEGVGNKNGKRLKSKARRHGGRRN